MRPTQNNGVIFYTRFSVSSCTARYGRYVSIRQDTGTRTTRYWAVLLEPESPRAGTRQRLVSPPRMRQRLVSPLGDEAPPCLLAGEPPRSLATSFSRKERRQEREKKRREVRTWSSTLLSRSAISR
ncbi:hypothetical protein BHM03_00061950 [Ensete ventricosum]|nr:hypothetical protein BHM03_00061950 [Ensete ventricosum]